MSDIPFSDKPSNVIAIPANCIANPAMAPAMEGVPYAVAYLAKLQKPRDPKNLAFAVTADLGSPLFSWIADSREVNALLERSQLTAEELMAFQMPELADFMGLEEDPEWRPGVQKILDKEKGKPVRPLQTLGGLLYSAYKADTKMGVAYVAMQLKPYDVDLRSDFHFARQELEEYYTEGHGISSYHTREMMGQYCAAIDQMLYACEQTRGPGGSGR